MPWTVAFEDMPADGTAFQKSRLGQYAGQIAQYMNDYSLIYGFMSTYNSTIFVKRTADYTFAFSTAIQHSSEMPDVTVRQAIIYLLHLAPKDSCYPSAFPLDSKERDALIKGKSSWIAIANRPHQV